MRSKNLHCEFQRVYCVYVYVGGTCPIMMGKDVSCSCKTN